MTVFIVGWLQIYIHTCIVNATSELPVQLSKLGHPESLLPWQPEVSLLLVTDGDGTSVLPLPREGQVFYL